jgi:hypothetical protein
MTTLHSAIISAGIALAGLLVAVAIVVTEPADPMPTQVQSIPEESRFHTVWMPKFIQLLAVRNYGTVPSCDALNGWIVDIYESFAESSTTGLGRFADDEWASLECRE